MAQYTIIGKMSAWKVLGIIEAESKDDAVEIAVADDMINNEAWVSLCHQCSNEIELGEIYEYEAEEID